MTDDRSTNNSLLGGKILRQRWKPSRTSCEFFPDATTTKNDPEDDNFVLLKERMLFPESKGEVRTHPHIQLDHRYWVGAVGILTTSEGIPFRSAQL